MASSERLQLAASNLVGRDDKEVVGNRVGNVDHSEVSSRTCAADRHPGLVTAGTVFGWAQQYILNLLLHNIMPIDVRQVGCRINVEPQFHPSDIIADLRNHASLLPCHDFKFS